VREGFSVSNDCRNRNPNPLLIVEDVDKAYGPKQCCEA
jgi:hypothetical protein